MHELMAGFYAELEKIAFSAATSRVLGGVGTGLGAGALLGAGVGAAAGGVHNYRAARQQGASIGQAAASGLGGAASGASTGALGGAVLGAAGMGAAGGLGKGTGLVRRLTASNSALGSGARFGQRQVHSLTGWAPEGGIRSIRGGAYAAEERLAKAKGLRDPKELAAATKGHEAATKAEAMGLTSLPGYGKALLNKETGGLVNNAGKVLKTGLSEQWHSGGSVNKALMFGVPTLSVASELAHKSQPGGPGRLERAGKHLGEFGMALGPIPVAGQMVAGAGLSAAGSRIGRVADKIRRRPASPQASGTNVGTTGESVPTEYTASDRATGSVGGV